MRGRRDEHRVAVRRCLGDERRADGATGTRAVLRNRPFLLLWLAQLLVQEPLDYLPMCFLDLRLLLLLVPNLNPVLDQLIAILYCC